MTEPVVVIMAEVGRVVVDGNGTAGQGQGGVGVVPGDKTAETARGAGTTKESQRSNFKKLTPSLATNNVAGDSSNSETNQPHPPHSFTIPQPDAPPTMCNGFFILYQQVTAKHGLL